MHARLGFNLLGIRRYLSPFATSLQSQQPPAHFSMPKRTAASSPAAAAADASPASPSKRGRKAKAEAPSEAAAQAAAASPATKKSPAKKKAAAAEEVAAPAPAEAPAAAAGDVSVGPPAKKARGGRKKEPEPERVVYSEALRPPPPEGPSWKIMSWNVAGLRALLKKDPQALTKLVEREQCEVLCLQEIKLQDKGVNDIMDQMGLKGWHATWNCCTAKAGYSGTVTLCKHKPLSATTGMGIPQHDEEGRLITVEYPRCYIVNTYVPNSGEGLKRLDYRVKSWDLDFSKYLQRLAERKPVVLTGDVNCAPTEIDIHAPKTNLRSAGFTQEERDSFHTNLMGPPLSLVDTFRRQYPDVIGYSYYTYKFNCRAKGKGWRLDNFLVSPKLADQVHDSFMLQDVMGSDHVPLGITIKGSCNDEGM